MICPYCNKSFKRESTITRHMCEQKRRHLAMKDRHVVIAFTAFNKFFMMSQKKQYSYDEFCKSPYYTAFVKFGSFVSNVNPLYPDNFIHYVITSGEKLDKWCNDALYDQYVIKLVKTESIETALERSITHFMKWGIDHKQEWNDYFRNVSLNRGTYDIKDGKVSPWLVLNSSNGKELLNKLDDEQLKTINSIMDIPYWLNQFRIKKSDLALVKSVIKESNL